jgi:hypothetical protein
VATYQFYAYASSALAYNSTTGAFVLSAGYDHTSDRMLVTITDDDSYFHGDYGTGADEIGSDANQTAVVTTPDGTVVAWGKVYDEAYAAVSDRDGGVIYLDRIEIGGRHIGYFASEPLEPGLSYPVLASYDVSVVGGTALTYAQIASVPCFATGTLITTKRGEIPVERLTTGTRILTLDHGYQPLLWSGRFAAAATGTTPPDEVVFAVGSLGDGLPRKPLHVTACHRMLLAGPRLALYFGENEALAAAGHMANGRNIVRRTAPAGRTFHHLLLPEHEIILANGVWTESLFAGGIAIDAQPPALRTRLRRLAASRKHVTARLCLRQREAALVRTAVATAIQDAAA